MKGGEKTKKFNNRLLFALLILIVLLCSISSAFAGDNETLEDVVCVSQDLDEISDISDNLTSNSQEDVLKTTNTINVESSVVMQALLPLPIIRGAA